MEMDDFRAYQRSFDGLRRKNPSSPKKQLMVQPNAPRFLREGDRYEFSTKL